MSVSSSAELKPEVPGVVRDVFDDCVFGSWPGTPGLGQSGAPSAGSAQFLAAPSYEHRLPSPPRAPRRRQPPLLKAQSFSADLGSAFGNRPLSAHRTGLLPAACRPGGEVLVRSTPIVQISGLSSASSHSSVNNSASRSATTHRHPPVIRAKSATPGEVEEKINELKRCISMPHTEQTGLSLPRTESTYIGLPRGLTQVRPQPQPILKPEPVISNTVSSSIYSAFDIVGPSQQARYPWQRDIGVQCNIWTASPTGQPVLSPPPPTPKHAARRQAASTQCNLVPPIITRHSGDRDQVVEIHTPSGTIIRPIFDRVSAMRQPPRDLTPPQLTVEFEAIDTSERQRLVESQEDEDDVATITPASPKPTPSEIPETQRYRADSLVSPPLGYHRQYRMWGYSQPVDVETPSSSDLGERSDTLSSPRVSPVPWLGSQSHSNVPELVVTSAKDHVHGKFIGKGAPISRREKSHLLTVPRYNRTHYSRDLDDYRRSVSEIVQPTFTTLRRSSSGSLHSASDESDTEPSPPRPRRGRRKAIFDSKSLGLASAPEDVSPSNSCDEGDGTSIASVPEHRLGRKRSSVDLGINYPGDLLVRDRQRKVLIKRNTIADFAATRAYQASTTSLISDQESKKLKGSFNLRKFIDKKAHRSKDTLSDLSEILNNLKPSTFKDNHLISYKEVHWSELIASTDKDKEGVTVPEMERKRREAVWEFFRCECVFLIDYLMVLKHCFMEPLKKVQVEGHLMFAEPGDLFGNLDELCYVSYTFCRDFISLLLKDAGATEFGQTEVLIKALQRYSQLSREGEVFHNYCLNYSKAINYLMENLRRNDDFGEFEKWCEQDIRCHRLQLTDLLISPMQHCTKVPLLLHNIRKYTEEQEERVLLTESLVKLETSLKNLEAKMKWLKNFERVQQIQQQIIWQPITELDPRAFIPDFLRSTLQRQPCERLLASPKRQLLHEGPLTLLEISKTVDMYLFLFDDILLLTKVKKPARKKTSLGTDTPNHLMTPRPQTDGAVFVVHRQPIALDRFTVHDVRPPDNSGFWEYFECGVHVSFGDNKECLPDSEDECDRQRSNLFFGCLSAANGLRNAFVLVQISRFQQIIGVYTLQAPTDAAKSQWLSMLRDAQDRYKEACNRNENLSPGDGRTFFSSNAPGSPHVNMPMSLKSNVDPKDIIKEMPPSSQHSPTDASSYRSSPEEINLLQVDTSPTMAQSTVSLPPPTTSRSTEGFPRTNTHRPVSATFSLSPPPAQKPRTRRLGTLKQLHDKCKSVDVMYL